MRMGVGAEKAAECIRGAQFQVDVLLCTGTPHSLRIADGIRVYDERLEGLRYARALPELTVGVRCGDVLHDASAQ